MFDSRAFRSWPHILLGGLGFGGLFALVLMLVDALFEGGLHLTRRAVVFGAGAFAGYVGMALLVRHRTRHESD